MAINVDPAALGSVADQLAAGAKALPQACGVVGGACAEARNAESAYSSTVHEALDTFSTYWDYELDAISGTLSQLTIVIHSIASAFGGIDAAISQHIE